jgi:hypothetical protein
MEFTHEVVPRDNRIIISLLAGLWFIVALVLLGVARPRPVALDPAAAAKEVVTAWLPALQRRFGLSTAFAGLVTSFLVSPADGWVDGPGLTVTLSLVGGALGALMLGPAWRYGRLVTGVASPRQYEDKYRLAGWRVALVRAGFALNLAVCALWVSLVLGAFGWGVGTRVFLSRWLVLWLSCCIPPTSDESTHPGRSTP